MNDLYRKTVDIIKNRIGIDNAILYVSLLILAVHFYPMAGRFLDSDEEYYFYITSAISKGAGIYKDLHFFYPPVLFYICSVFFKFPLSLYHSLLAIRIFIVSLSMLSFYLIFDVFKRLKLSWFIIPALFFILYSKHLDLKLIEYNSDNALWSMIIFQCYLIFLSARRKKITNSGIIAITLLSILSFHINQKAVFLEPPIFLAFLFCFFDDIERFILKYKAGLAFIFILGLLFMTFSNGYHRFFMRSYIYPSNVSGVFPVSAVNYIDKLAFILFYFKFNPAFWLIGLTSFATLLFYFKKDRIYFAPLMFLFGSLLLIASSLKIVFPYIQYQLYYIWATLFSLPYFISLCIDAFPKKKSLIFTIILLLSITGIFTFAHFYFPFKPLKEYAAEIDRVREIVGQNGLASYGGSSVNIKSDSPDCFSKDIINILKEKGTKYIFIDPRMLTKKGLFGEDGNFIATNYQKCPDLPLMIASKWVYLEPGQKNVDIEIAGQYKTLLITSKYNSVVLDNHKLQNLQVLDLKRGRHVVNTSQPAVLLIEFNSDKTSSESLYNLNLASFDFIPLNKIFSGKFELMGIIKYKISDKLFFHFFWKALADVNDEQMTFHHFCDSNGNYITAANVDPTDGWYDIRSVKKGEEFSYMFSVDKNEKYKFINIGWFFKQDWSRRLMYGNSTFFTLPL